MSSSKFPIREWYLDRDFPEIKVCNSQILIHFDSFYRGKAQDMCDEHNSAIQSLTALQAENERLKDQATEWERLANEWREDYDKLKNKYEPMIAITSEALKPQGEKHG